MVNSLFSFSENVFLLPSFLKEISTGYGIQVARVLFFFSFSTLKMCLLVPSELLTGG